MNLLHFCIQLYLFLKGFHTWQNTGTMDAEEQWKLRVFKLLKTNGQMKSLDIGVVEGRPGRKTIAQVLKSDARFVVKRSVISLAHEPSFCPKPTEFSPPHLCWDVVLSNQHTAATLSSWRWLWLLPQVCKAFALQPDSWLKWMCVADTVPKIWKTKAGAVLALTAKDLQDVNYCKVHSSGWKRRHETHLMRRDSVLELALAKHGGTHAGINAVFWKRKEAKKKRKKTARYGRECSESDEEYYIAHCI